MMHKLSIVHSDSDLLLNSRVLCLGRGWYSREHVLEAAHEGGVNNMP